MNTVTPTLSHQVQLKALCEAVRFFAQQGWTPATSSNFSHRATDFAGFYISASGLDKATLTPADFLSVHLEGHPLDSDTTDAKPSAETLIHAVIYQQFESAQCICHTHSVMGTWVSQHMKAQSKLAFSNLEILKGFADIHTHQTQVELPIFENQQDMRLLSQQIADYFKSSTQPIYAILLAGHGCYTWGRSVAEAKRHMEVLEFLFHYQVLTLQHECIPVR